MIPMFENGLMIGFECEDSKFSEEITREVMEYHLDEMNDYINSTKEEQDK